MTYNNKRADAENARKGGVGIDDNRDIDWVYHQTDFEANKAMFGRSWPNRDGHFGLDTCSADYKEPADISGLLDDAREGNRPLMGPGSGPTSPEQTG